VRAVLYALGRDVDRLSGWCEQALASTGFGSDGLVLAATVVDQIWVLAALNAGGVLPLLVSSIRGALRQRADRALTLGQRARRRPRR
jgi:hypothetical protein